MLCVFGARRQFVQLPALSLDEGRTELRLDAADLLKVVQAGPKTAAAHADAEMAKAVEEEAVVAGLLTCGLAAGPEWGEARITARVDGAAGLLVEAGM